MPVEIERLCIDQVAENLNRRRVPLSGIERTRRPGPYRYFGAQGVIDHIDDYLFEGEHILVAEDGENLRSRKQPVAFLVSGKFWVNNHAHILKVREEIANSQFLVHAINLADMAGLITGAAQPKLTKANLERLAIPAYSKREQDRIAAVLAGFDELIAINERRIELLEDLARSLYCEWFVRFRFPGADPAPVNGEPPPEWTVGCLGDVAEINQHTAKRNELPDSVRYVDISSVSPRHIEGARAMSAAEAPGRARRRLRDGDTIWAMVRPNRRSHALVHDPPEDMIASTGFAVLSPSDVPAAFLFEYTSRPEFADYLMGRATGAAYPAVRPGDFEEAPLLIPTPDVLVAFGELVDPALRLVSQLAAQNAMLARTRDLLLPRLVTGRLDISDIDLGDLLPAELAA